MNRLPILLNLVRNAMRYRVSKVTGWPCSVEAISLEITRRCIGRCVMCNIWKNASKAEDLPIDTWLNLLRSPALRTLRELDITGGEPFLRQDLDTFVKTIVAEKPARFPQLRTIAITTNGFLTRRVVRMVTDMARDLRGQAIELVLAVAVDGVGEAHELIRGVKGTWKRVASTLEGLVELRREFPHVIVGIKMTVLPQNLSELEPVTQFAQARCLFTIVSPCILTKVRYGNLDRATDLRFDERDREKLIDFFSGRTSGWSYHDQVLLDYLKKGRVYKPCTAGFNYFFVRSSGEVYPCPLVDHPIGNISDERLETLIQSAHAATFRKGIGTFQECQTCTEPGLERYALPCEGITYASLLLGTTCKEAETMHRHLGLDKYV